MGQILHANARTTEAIRREIRNSEESIAKAAARFNASVSLADPSPIAPKSFTFIASANRFANVLAAVDPVARAVALDTLPEISPTKLFAVITPASLTVN